MRIEDVPFDTIDWSKISPELHNGITGKAYWKTYEQGNIRVRMVEYTPGYAADHWCSRGHVILVLEGELETELSDGRVFKTKAGQCYVVAEAANPHRSSTKEGAKLFIVD